ncbi:TolC family protein [Cesiribacter sp. SM1]|uniref:TolC family protein n=1 Tax=Cesiribacter sp. SM1 TaxID=2861196 RepID=UPI001CD33577|nr:TolC family protein [Cesiribacter sp. SM1]
MMTEVKIILVICLTSFTLLSSMVAFAQEVKETWSLDECVAVALQNNIELEQSKLSSETLLINVKEQQAQRLPSLNGGASLGSSWGRSIDPYSNEYVNQNIQTSNFSLNAGVTLFNGLRISNTIEQSKLQYKAGKLDLESLQQNITLNTVTAYMQVLLAYEQEALARFNRIATEEQLQKTRRRFEAGAIAKTDVYQLEAQLADDAAAVVVAENALRMAKINLAQIMNIGFERYMEVEKPAVVDVPLNTYSDLSPATLYEAASKTQVQLQSAKIGKEVAELETQIASSKYYPSLSLNGNLLSGYSSARKLSYLQLADQTTVIGYVQGNINQAVVAASNYRTVYGDYAFRDQLQDNLSQAVSLSLSVPIYNNRKAKSSVQRASIGVRSAELNEAKAKNELRQKVEQLYADWSAAATNLQARKDQLYYRQEAFSNIEKQYNLGLANSLDLLTAKTSLQQAQAALLQARYQYLFNTKLIDFYTGRAIQL